MPCPPLDLTIVCVVISPYVRIHVLTAACDVIRTVVLQSVEHC